MQVTYNMKFKKKNTECKFKKLNICLEILRWSDIGSVNIIN